MALYKTLTTTPPTPFYYYDMTLLRATLQQCKREASKYNFHVHYAMKANVEPRILHEVQRAGLGADCVSGWEVKSAINNGFSPSQIVFAGVGKSDREMRWALSQNIFAFNCESLEELEILNEIADDMGKVATVALRINPDIEPNTHPHISTGQCESKFGISYTETNTVIANLEKYKNLNIIGLHFHIGSQIRDMKSFEELALRSNIITKWFEDQGIEIKYLNMGGGLGVDYLNPDKEPIPDFGAYFKVFADNLKLSPNQSVHFELGRSLVAQCGELITQVLFTKDTGSGSHIAIVDAGMTELIRPAFYQAHHMIENLSATDRPLMKFSIAGPICESSDFFARSIDFPATKRGDLLAIRSIGAYGSIMSSHYNLRPTIPSYFTK